MFYMVAMSFVQDCQEFFKDRISTSLDDVLVEVLVQDLLKLFGFLRFDDIYYSHKMSHNEGWTIRHSLKKINIKNVS